MRGLGQDLCCDVVVVAEVVEGFDEVTAQLHHGHLLKDIENIGNIENERY
jgi:hypothetical protein